MSKGELTKLGHYLVDNGHSRKWLAKKIRKIYGDASESTVYWRLVNMCLGRAKFVLASEKAEIAKVLRCNEEEIFDVKK